MVAFSFTPTTTSTSPATSGVKKRKCCSRCGCEGHDIRKCTASDAEAAMLLAAKNDLKKKEKEKKAKESSREQREKRNMTEEKKTLPELPVRPGRLRPNLLSPAATPRDALMLVLKEQFMKEILKIVNENRY